MNKEQLNKIDEEFGIIKLLEDLITVVSDTDILDTDDVENFYRNEDRIINSQKIDNAWKALNLKGKLASIFHSKLQEAIKDERERIIQMIDKFKVSDSNDVLKYFAENGCQEDIATVLDMLKLADVQNKLIEDITKPLQTNNTNI